LTGTHRFINSLVSSSRTLCGRFGYKILLFTDGAGMQALSYISTTRIRRGIGGRRPRHEHYATVVIEQSMQVFLQLNNVSSENGG